MTWQYTSFVVPIVVGCVLSVLLAAYTLRHVRGDRWTPVATSFLAVTVGLALWTGLAALKLLATGPWVKLALYRLLYLGVAPLGALALLFALAYTDRDQWITTPVVAGLLCIPALYVCLVFLNPANLAIESTRLVETNGIVVMRVEVGPAHWLLESLYNATLSLVALGVIGYEAVRLGRSYLPQAALIAAGISAPFVFVILSAVGVQPFDPDGVNLVPASSAVTASALGVAVFRYRLLELPPLAYTTAIEQSPDGVLVVDTAERVVHANDRGEELLSRHDAAVGDRLDEAFPEVDLSTADADTVSVDATPGTVRLDAATGPPSFFSTRTRDLTRAGSRIGRVVVFRDVTELERKRQDLQEQNERLEEFVSVVSHDLRNPLNVASGRVELARAEHDSDHLAATTRAHDRMEGLISDLLTLAREGEAVRDPERTSLPELFESAWRGVRTGDGTLVVRTDAVVEADPGRLRQLFENLVRNAVEHGGSDVTVTLGETTDGFYVADDGPGIPDDERAQVVESGYSTADGGTGFGLAIVSEIATAHGWDVTVTESDAGGARFEFSGVQLS